MNKEERDAKLEELKEKMSKLTDKIKDSADTMKIVGMEAKDKINVAAQETKSAINAMKENFALYGNRASTKLSSELLKAQMNIDEAKKNIIARKEAQDKEKLAKYIDDELEYASSCIELSLLAAEESKLAFLEAAEAQKEYDEKYGKEENKEDNN